MAEVAYLTSLRVAPQNVFQSESAVRAMYNALAVEEFNVDDGVETYAIHRDPEDEGAYQIYEQYATAAAARRHLTGPNSRAASPGRRCWRE